KHEARIAGSPAWIAALLYVTVFLVDATTPRGVASGVAYIPLIFCGLWFAHPRATFVLALIATLLSVVAVFAKPPGSADLWFAVTNRAILAFAVWAAAAGLYLHRRNEAALRQVEVLRRQAAEKNALFASIVATSDDAIISKTLDGIITSWNASA